MNVRLLAATVTVVSLAWLGTSFATPTEEPIDPRVEALRDAERVGAEHPDSHRLGARLPEEVALPRWDGDAGQPAPVPLVVLLGE